MTAIKAIIFDLGKVIFDVSFDRAFASWAKNANKPLAEIKNRFRFDDLYEKFERGEITSPEFRKSLSQRLGISLWDKLFDKGWCNLYLDVYPESEELLARLKNNFRVVALTNTNKIHETVWKVKYHATLQHFEKVFTSSHMKTRKPERACYKRCLIIYNWLRRKPYSLTIMRTTLRVLKDLVSNPF